MANPIETAGRYAGSVLTRTAGFEAAGLVIKTPLADVYPGYSWKHMAGRVMLRNAAWMYQFVFPATTEFWSHYIGVKTPKLEGGPRTFPLMLMGAVAFDTVVAMAAVPYLAREYNLDPFAVKAGMNVLTHVGLDLAGRAIDKMKGFKPTAVTLAV